ncbi:hypothetical protein Tco_1259477 [Tanacetum coccineum]
MKAAVDQCSADKNVFEIKIKQLRFDNDQILNQIMSQEIVHIVANSVDILDVKKSCVNNFSKCLELETELLKKKDFIKKEAYNKLVKSYSNLENGKDSVENVKKDIDEIETINIVYVSQTCPTSQKPSEKLVAVTLMNKDKRVTFTKPVTSSSNIPKQTDSLKTKDSNKSLLTSTGVKLTTSARGSKPSGNTKNNRITRPPHNNKKNKVEDYSRKVKSSLNRMNSVSEPVNNALVKHYMRNAKLESICAICNKCLFDANHDMCLIDFVNVRSKSKSKRNKMRKAWKPTGKVFTDVGYKWKPTRRFFTIVSNSCPLTRITPKKIVHLKETTSKSVETLIHNKIYDNISKRAIKNFPKVSLKKSSL